jgi:DNA-binding response OmpR family regulator
VPRTDTGGGAGEAARTGYRVLVVDDEPAIRTLVRVNLGVAGMQVVEAADGESAVRMALETHPDLILLDVMLPGETGWDVATELAQHADTREIPLVFLTAMADDGDLVRGQAQGAVGYITKPFDPVGLSAIVERTLERIARGERDQLQAEITGIP